MVKITIKEIRALGCCYDPSKYLPENWTGTALDIINMSEVPPRDRLWVLCREQFIGAYALGILEALSVGMKFNHPDARAFSAAYGFESSASIRVLKYLLEQDI